MMGAAIALQTAVVAHLGAITELTGVFHDAPARAPFPYAVLVCSDEKDWSCKGREGREVALQLVLWDDKPARLLQLEDQATLSPDALDLGGDWHLSTLQLTGKRRVRNPVGAWNCIIELRARMLVQDSGDEA